LALQSYSNYDKKRRKKGLRKYHEEFETPLDNDDDQVEERHPKSDKQATSNTDNDLLVH